MELGHLRYFVAVAEELHFGRAAGRLHVAQPALSTHIQRLEKELGVKLLHRTSRSVRLTEAGREFLEEAYMSLDHSERAVRNARRAASGEVGHVRVGLVGSATYTVLTEIISLFRGRFPEVSLTPREMNTVPQTKALLGAGGLDVGFLRPSSDHDSGDLEVEAFVEEPLIALLPASHPLADGRRIELGSLSEVPFILAASHREPGMNEQVVDACERAGFVPKVAEETTELPVALGLIAAGVGVTLLPASVGKVKSAGVSYRNLTQPVPTTKLSVAYNPNSLTPAARTFLNFARDFAQK